MLGLLLAAILAAPSSAQSFPPGWKTETIKAWGGINILQDTTMIDGDAQSAINVLTDNTYLEKRPGNVFLASFTAGVPIKYVTGWNSASGSNYLVAQSSSNIYAADLSGRLISLSTITSGYDLSAVAAFSRLEFADGYRPIWYFTGSSTATVADITSGQTAPVCTVLAFQDSRLWCGNLPDGFSSPGNVTNGGGSSTVLLSSAGGDGYWDVPYNVNSVANSANRFDLTPNDGDQINCMASTPWGMFVGKKNSSYFIKGSDNLSYYPMVLDPKIGCVDQRSVQMNYGVFTWLAVDGVYGYAGSGKPQLLTRDLDPLFATIRNASFTRGLWSTQLQTDWATGTESTAPANIPPYVWDYFAIPGTIFPSSGTLYDDNTSPGAQPCSSNINPANGLPWSCGVGFSSDTLVNIDTASVPLSGGYAQLALSTSTGVSIWQSSSTNFVDYIVGSTTFTLAAGTVDPVHGGLAGGSFQNNVLYTMAASKPTNSPAGGKGWNYGAWQIAWFPYFYQSVAVYNLCGLPGDYCFEYDFIANKTPYVNAGWSGYGIQVQQTTIEQFVVNLEKVVSGAYTSLGSYTFGIDPESNSFTSYSTFTITRTPGGAMSVYLNGVDIIDAADNTPAAENAVETAINMFGTHGTTGGANYQGFNVVDLVSLNGYGSGSLVSRIYDTGSSDPLAGVLSSSYTLTGDGATSLDFYLRSSNSSTMADNPAFAASSTSLLVTLPKRYWQYEAVFETTVASETPKLSSIELSAITTGQYYSKVDYVGTAITTWQQFSATVGTPSIYTYSVRSATYAFLAAAALPAWTTITSGSQIGISTGSYAQFEIDSTPLTSNPSGASAAEPIDAVFLHWNSGTDVPAASAALNRRYMLCVTVSSAATTPDTCLIRQKNNKWVQWSTTNGSIGSLGIYNYNIVLGDGGNTGKVWDVLQPNVYSDDGSAINSSWVTADFTSGSQFLNKIYHEAWLDIQPVQNSSMTFSYSVSKSSTFVDSAFTIDDGQPTDPTLPVALDEFGNINKWIEPAAGFDTGKYIQAKFWDTGLPGNYWRVNDFILLVEPQSRMVP